MELKQRLLEALKGCRADYADIRFDENIGCSFVFRGEEQDSSAATANTCGIIRACVKGGWGLVSFDNLSNLKELVSQACSNARLVGKSKTCLAEAPICTDDFPAVMKNDFRGKTFAEKVAAVSGYNRILLKSAPNITSTVVSYTDTFQRVHFASTRGACFMEERPHLSFKLFAIASKGDMVQKAFKSIGNDEDFGAVENQEKACEMVAKQASDLLNAPQCPGGRTTVILNPSFTGLFTHEAFGHLSEADFLYENPQMRKLMHIGRQMGPDFLNILDDGTLPGHMGTRHVDDEGTPTRCNALIRNGVLVGHLHSLETAGKMGEQATGNARGLNGGCPPIVRMTNTFIAPGSIPPEQLFADVDDGIYCCNGFAGQTMMEMFTFTATHGYRIRKGKVCELLRDVMVTGNVFETLQNIDGIANDFEMENSGGGCGKGGQSPLPVGTGGPHIRIRNVVMAGRK